MLSAFEKKKSNRIPAGAERINKVGEEDRGSQQLPATEVCSQLYRVRQSSEKQESPNINTLKIWASILWGRRGRKVTLLELKLRKVDRLGSEGAH